MRSPVLFAVAMAIPSGTPFATMAVACFAATDAASPFSLWLCFEAKERPVGQGIDGHSSELTPNAAVETLVESNWHAAYCVFAAVMKLSDT